MKCDYCCVIFEKRNCRWIFFWKSLTIILLFLLSCPERFINLTLFWHKEWLWGKKRSENLMMEHSSSSPARPPQRMQPHHLQKVTNVQKSYTKFVILEFKSVTIILTRITHSFSFRFEWPYYVQDLSLSVICFVSLIHLSKWRLIVILVTTKEEARFRMGLLLNNTRPIQPRFPETPSIQNGINTTTFW